MYNYVLSQWKMSKISSEYILARVPKWINQNQAETILATPQDLIGQASITEVI